MTDPRPTSREELAARLEREADCEAPPSNEWRTGQIEAYGYYPASPDRLRFLAEHGGLFQLDIADALARLDERLERLEEDAG